MCGVALCCCGAGEEARQAVWRDLRRRGPDHFSSSLVEEEGRELAEIAAAVLHIQGEELAAQPLWDDSGGCLLWNGEIFGVEGSTEKLNKEHSLSDTFVVSRMLSCALANVTSDDDEETCCTELATKASICLAHIEGPYAFIYYHRPTRCIVYGRDPFGRRSLVGLRKCDDGDNNTNSFTIIASTASIPEESFSSTAKWEELSVDGIYCQKLQFSIDWYDNNTDQCPKLIQVPWPTSRCRLGFQFSTSASVNQVELAKNDSSPAVCSSLSSREESTSLQFLDVMKSVIFNRISLVHDISREHESCSPIGVLFSGGIDSVFLTAVLHSCLPNHFSIDLINVSFNASNGDSSSTSISEETPSPDRLAAIAACGELQKLYPSRQWRLVHVDVTPKERESHEERVIQLIQPQCTHMDLNIGTAFWFASRGEGYTRDYSIEQMDSAFEVVQEDGRPLLRKGGEGYALSRGESVATKEQTKESALSHSESIESSVDTLSVDSPTVDTVFVKRNRKKDERLVCSNLNCSQISKPGCINALCKRCCVQKYKTENSAMFASSSCDSNPPMQCPVHKKKVKGTTPVMKDVISDVKKSSDDTNVNSINLMSGAKIPYQCRCKILIVGIGADEQLAGYSRHRTVFKRGGIKALVNELNMDTARIYTRNLGRDDRCISDHGKEAWFPFLDEEIVRFLQHTPLDMICNLDEPQGEGDKRVLRDASRALGLQSCTSLVKRAIQFGTRVAKHTNVKYHGSNRNGKGTTKIKKGI